MRIPYLSRLMEIKEEQLRLETHKHINDLYMCDRLDDILKHINDLYMCDRLDDILKLMKGGAKNGKNKNKRNN